MPSPAHRDRDADVRLQLHLRPRQDERLAQHRHDPFHRQRRVGRGGQPVEQHAEFVAAQAGDRVLAADAAAQPLGDHRQGRVAGAEAQAVVDPLEAFEVAEQHADGAAVAPGRQERVLDAVDEERPVGEAGQRVVEGLVAQLGLELVALGHVAGVEDDAAHRLHVDQVGHPDLGVAPGPVGVPDPAFASRRSRPSSSAALEVGPDAVRVVGMDQVAEVDADHLIRRRSRRPGRRTGTGSGCGRPA